MKRKEMKRLVILPAIMFVFCLQVKAQPTTVLGGNQAKAIDMNLYPYGTISQIGLPEKTTKGSVYLYDDWRLGKAVTNKGATIKDYPFKLDLVNQLLEINTNQGIRVIELKQVDSIAMTTATSWQYFINAKKYNGQQAQVTGLLEVVHYGDLSLLKYNYIYAKEGTYNAALDVGSNETKLIVRSKYFLFGNGLAKLTEVPKNKKKLMEMFKETDKESVEAFMSENKLGLKDEKELKMITGFLNEKKLTLAAEI